MIPFKYHKILVAINVWAGIIKTLSGVLINTFEGETGKAFIDTHDEKVSDAKDNR